MAAANIKKNGKGKDSTLPLKRNQNRLKSLLLLLLAAVLALAVILISQRISSKTAVAPNAPESNPFAFEMECTSDRECDSGYHCNADGRCRINATPTPTSSTTKCGNDVCTSKEVCRNSICILKPKAPTPTPECKTGTVVCPAEDNLAHVCVNGKFEIRKDITGLCQCYTNPATFKCNGNVLYTCSNGKWVKNKSCANGCYNDGGLTDYCNDCKPGTKSCSSSTVQTCTSLGKWEKSYTCTASEKCVSGACVKK